MNHTVRIYLFLLFTISLMLSGCSNQTRMGTKLTSPPENSIIVLSEQVTNQPSSDSDEIQTKIINERTTTINLSGSYPPLLDTSFMADNMGFYTTSVRTFVEDLEMDLPYQEGKAYLYIEGTVYNYGESDRSLYEAFCLTPLDANGTQIGNASSWIQTKGIYETIPAEGEIEYCDLFIFDSSSESLTFIFTPKQIDLDPFIFCIDTSFVNSEVHNSSDITSQKADIILQEVCKNILTALCNHNYEDIAQYSSYTFLCPNPEIPLSDCIYLESYNWIDLNEYEEIYHWGNDIYGNSIDLSCEEYLTNYVQANNFLNSEPEIVNERIPFYEETLPDYYATHYARYQNDKGSLYFVFEETYLHEFTLSGILTEFE